jgi:hypothetical protein
MERALEAFQNGEVGFNAACVNSLPYSKSCAERQLDWKNNFAVENTQVTGNVEDISPRVQKELTDHILRLSFFVLIGLN